MDTSHALEQYIQGEFERLRDQFPLCVFHPKSTTHSDPKSARRSTQYPPMGVRRGRMVSYGLQCSSLTRRNESWLPMLLFVRASTST